jgi:hypothetical protein
MLFGNNTLYSAFQGAKSESNRTHLFRDEAHRFHMASEEREDELFWVQDSMQKKSSLVTDVSRVTRNMPRKFRVLRIYGMGSDIVLENLKGFFQSKGEGNQCGV